METQSYGSVAAMQFRRRPAIDFKEIVEEFDNAFHMVDAQTRALKWDGDDIAVIDRDSVRVALGWLSAETDKDRWHLVVAVGAAPGKGENRIDSKSFGFLADQIVEHSRARLPFFAVLRGPAHKAVGAELIDETFDLLRMDTDDMPGDRREVRKKMAFPENVDDYADMFSQMNRPWRRGANADAATTPGQDCAPAGESPDETAETTLLSNVTGRIHKMLEQRAKPTEPLRLTIHTLALSLCLYAPPLGAFMFTYTMLRDIVPMSA